MSTKTNTAMKDYLESQLGRQNRYTLERPGKPELVIVGVIDQYEILGQVILDTKTNKVWPAFRLRIKPDDGGRAVWTCAFPYKEEEHSALKQLSDEMLTTLILQAERGDALAMLPPESAPAMTHAEMVSAGIEPVPLLLLAHEAASRLRDSIRRPRIEFIDDTVTVNGHYVACADDDEASEVYLNLLIALSPKEEETNDE